MQSKLLRKGPRTKPKRPEGAEINQERVQGVQNTPKMLGKVPRISTKKDRLERTGTDNAPREIVEDKPFITELLVAELALTLLNFLFVIKKILGDI